MSQIRAAFERMRTFHVTIEPTKANFLYHKLTILGHIISAQGIRMSSEPTSVVLRAPFQLTPKRYNAF